MTWLSVKSAAAELDCSEQHIRNLVHKGDLPHKRFGNLIRIPLDAVTGNEQCDLSSTEESGPSDTKAEEYQPGSNTDQTPAKLRNGRHAKRFKNLPRLTVVE